MGGGGSQAAGWRALGWAVAAVALWLAADAATLSTTVTIHAEDTRMVLDAAGARVAAPFPARRITGLRVTAASSIDPPRRLLLEAWQDDALVLRRDLPSAALRRPRRPHPVGDWHVDRTLPTATLVEVPLELAPPYTVRLSFRGRTLEAVAVVLGSEPAVEGRIRRGMINDDLAWAVPGVSRPLRSVPLPPRVAPRLGGIAATLLRGLSGGCGLLAAAWLAAVVQRRRGPLHLPAPDVSVRGWWTGVGLLAAAAAARSAWLAGVVLERVPHTPDGVAYLLQARWLLDGGLSGVAPRVPEWFDIPFTFVHGGRWLSQYPPAWPAVLAVGHAVDAAWLVAPVLGAVFVVVVALLGRELHRPGVGLLAAALATVSPMSALVFGSHLSHSASAPLVAVFLWLAIASGSRGRPRLGAPAGLAIGVAFGMRPLTAVAVAAPVAVAIAIRLVRGPGRAAEARRLLWITGGGLVGLAPTLLANLDTTGNPLRFAYALAPDPAAFGRMWVPTGLGNLDVITASVPPQLLGAGWGLLPSAVVAAFALGLAAVPLLRLRPRSGDVLMLTVWGALAVSHVGTPWSGLHGYGPRYQFEAFAPLLVLAAAGVARLGSVEAGEAARRHRGPPVLTALLVIAALTSTAVALPGRLARYRGYNHVDGLLVRAVSDLGLERGLVVLPTPPWYDWGRAAPLLPASPDGELLFVASPDDLAALLAAYPDRPAYLWTGDRLEPLLRPTVIRAPGPGRAPPGPRPPDAPPPPASG